MQWRDRLDKLAAMLEFAVYVLYLLAPILIPILVVGWLMRRRTKKRLHEQQQQLGVIEGKVNRIDNELVVLRNQVAEFVGRFEAGAAEPEKAPEPEPEPIRRVSKAIKLPEEAKKAPPPEPEKVAKPSPDYDFGGPAVTEPVQRPTAVVEPPSPTGPSPLEVLISKFLENWTGILGTVVLVAGIGFIGTYAALRLTPFFRFLLVLASSGALFMGYYSLRTRENWQAMGLWFRSAAAAVFLFACAAAGGLPNAGLMWIEPAGSALALLMVGIAVNLALSWLVGYQGFAALHVVLALIPIAILPQNPLALGIATVISGFGIFLTHRRRWPVHLAVTLAVYLVFHVYWVIQQPTGVPLASDLLPLAVGSAAVVFLGGALAPHGPVFKSESPALDSVLINLASWGFLIGAVVWHLKDVDAFGGHLLGTALAFTAAIAWVMSASAEKNRLHWLRTAEVLIAQGLVVASLFTWRPEFDEPLAFYGLVFAEALLFLRLVIRDRENTEAWIGSFVAAIAAIAFIAAGVFAIGSIETVSNAWRLAGMMVAGLAVTIAAGAYFDHGYSDRFNRIFGPDSMLVVGSLSGLMMTVALIALFNELPVGLVALAAGIGFIIGSGRLKALGLAWAAWMILLVAHGITWINCFDAYAGNPLEQLMLLIPTVALTIFGIRKPPAHTSGGTFRVIAIYLLGINLGLAAYLLLAPSSALLPTVAWLVMSLIALETAGRLGKPTDVLPTLHIGYAYVVAAALGYATVVLPTVSYLGPINLRQAIEVFGLATLAYWWLVQPGEPLASHRHWSKVHPYFLEMMLALLTTIVFVEVPLVWRPVAWMIIALLFLAPFIAALSKRIAFYSLAAFYTSVLAVAVNLSTTSVPSPDWLEQPWNTGLFAVAFQVAYLFVAYRYLALDKVTCPQGLVPLARLSHHLSRDLPAAICYPFFAGLALFLAWRFEQALLTFLWSAEAFVVYVLSIVFRESHFRLVALGGIAVCLGRLVIYDMQQSDLFIRGLVFIGVGLLMLGMNAVYNKYGRKVQMP